MSCGIRDNYNDYELTQEDFDFLMGQLKAKHMVTLKKEMLNFAKRFGVSELRSLVKSVTCDMTEND